MTVEELLAEADADGHKRGAHIERDQVGHRKKQVKKTTKDEDATLHRSVLYAEEGMPAIRHLLLPPMLQLDRCAGTVGEPVLNRHLNPESKRCSTIIYRYTLVCPGCCLSYSGNAAEPSAGGRLEATGFRDC